MTQKQSIISAIVTFILIFIAPRLANHGITLDEVTVTSVVTGIVAIIAWAWTTYFNCNLTEEGYEGTLVTRELKSDDDNVEEGEV